MADAIELQVGRGTWPLAVPPEKVVELQRVPIPPRPAASPREQVRAALDAPFGFEPLRRALTPDDRIAVVLDPDLPQAAELLAGVLDHLGTTGIGPAAVTVLTLPGARQDWIDDLPDEYADLTAETHDPSDRTKLAYLATTKSGRRVYLNRTLVEADFMILLTGRGYDPLTGYAGAEAAVFPALGDDEIRGEFAGDFSSDAPGSEAWPVRTESGEVAWLLGTPFLVQVILGADDTVQDVVAGLLDSGAEGVRRQDARWRGSVADRQNTVVAAVSGDPGRASFLDLAKAAAAAARVVQPGGRIVVLSDAAPQLGDGADLLRRTGDPKKAAKLLPKEKPADWAACFLWCFAAKTGNLFLASSYPEDVVEELFATPVGKLSEVQRLVEAAEQVLVIPDAHRMMVEVK
jgi:nickel-dependent lactate racemase